MIGNHDQFGEIMARSCLRILLQQKESETFYSAANRYIENPMYLRSESVQKVVEINTNACIVWYYTSEIDEQIEILLKTK